MMGGSMTSRERVEHAIRFEQPDRVPFNFWMDRRRMAELETQHGPEFRVRHFGADVIESYACFPAFPMAEHAMRDGTSWMVRELFEDWREALAMPMPDPNDPALYAQLDRHLAEYSDCAIIANSANVLTIAELMKRQENLYVDMLTQPEEVAAMFDRISDVMAAVAENVCKRDITALYVQDDIAFNKGLLVSMDIARAFVFPNWRKVMDVAHAHGKPVFFHTDGKCDDIWDVLADELGVRMLNPLQPELQSIEEFKARYHGRMGIYGGIQTGRIHLMSPAEIRAHVRDLFAKAGADGGLIMSTHDIDYTTTDEQFEALAAAMRECVY